MRKPGASQVLLAQADEQVVYCWVPLFACGLACLLLGAQVHLLELQRYFRSRFRSELRAPISGVRVVSLSVMCDSRRT